MRRQVQEFKEKLERPTSFVDALVLNLFKVFCEIVKVETLENIEHKQTNTEETGEENEEKKETRVPDSRPRIELLVAKTISVRENQGGVTYKDLFGDYLRTAKEISITDPFIRQPYQIDNLVDFIQMVREVSTVHDTVKIH